MAELLLKKLTEYTKPALKNQRILLKYNAEIEKDKYRAWILEKLKGSQPVVEFLMGHIKNEENTETFVILTFKTAIQKNVDIFTIGTKPPIQPTIYALKGEKDLTHANKILALDPENKNYPYISCAFPF